MDKQMELDFDSLTGEPVETEAIRDESPIPERDYEHEPGAILNSHGIWVSDLDLPF